MIARYPGVCMFCRNPIEVGVDIYDTEIKKAYHQACHEVQPPGPDAFRLAGELGFVPHEDAAIRAAIPAWRVRQDWLLRPLFNGMRSDSARRVGTPALPQSHHDPFHLRRLMEPRFGCERDRKAAISTVVLFSGIVYAWSLAFVPFHVSSGTRCLSQRVPVFCQSVSTLFLSLSKSLRRSWQAQRIIPTPFTNCSCATWATHGLLIVACILRSSYKVPEVAHFGQCSIFTFRILPSRVSPGSPRG